MPVTPYLRFSIGSNAELAGLDAAELSLRLLVA